MHRFLQASAAATVALLCLWAGAAQAQTTYSYTGRPFVVADPPYTTADRIVGSFETAEPLEPWLIGVDIAARVTSFSYSDGQQTRTQVDSEVCAFRVTTDATGAIVDWVVNLRELPLPAPGSPQRFLDSTRSLDQGGAGPAGSSPCDSFVPTLLAGVSNTPGDWTGGSNVPATPAEYAYDGAAFIQFDPPFTGDDSIDLTIRLAGPLPPLLNDVEIAPLVDVLTIFDGETTASGLVACTFRISTDARGAPVAWEALIGLDPPPPPPPPPGVSSFPHWRISDTGDSVGQDIRACPSTSNVISASSAVAGTWSSDAIEPASPTTYLYQSAPYATFVGNVPNEGQLLGRFTLDAPLPPDLPLTDLTASLTDLQFSDPIQQRTLADTIVCDFRVATDARGAIVDWVLLLREAPTPPAQAPVFTIDSTPSSTQSGIGLSNGFECDGIGLTDFASTRGRGTWYGGAARAVPALGAWALAVLAVLMGVLAVRGVRIRSHA